MSHSKLDLCPHRLASWGGCGNFSWTRFFAPPALMTHILAVLREEKVNLTPLQQALVLTLLGLLLLPVLTARPRHRVMSLQPPHHQLLTLFQSPFLPSDGCGRWLPLYSGSNQGPYSEFPNLTLPNHEPCILEGPGRGPGRGPGTPSSGRQIGDFQSQLSQPQGPAPHSVPG